MMIVVGGHSRNVGKTSVVAGLISRFPELNWTAVKITQFGHGVCSVSAEPCECALNDDEHSWSLSEETDHSGQSDTSRFLVAGAKRSLWVRTKQGKLAEAMPRLREELTGAENVIIESNSIIRFLRPDVYISVLDGTNADFKNSSREFLDRADLLLVRDNVAHARWENVSLKPVKHVPVVRFRPPVYVNDELVGFVRKNLTADKEG